MQFQHPHANSDTSATVAAEALPEARRVYQTPVLTMFGDVRLLTGSASGSGADGGTTPGMTKMSDLRCKEAVIRIGDHPRGFGLYLFSYKSGCGPVCPTGTRHFGVVAQEVAAIVPAAVSVAANGFLQVDYGMLGIHPVRH